MSTDSPKSSQLSRVLACIAVAAWILLLRPYPITTFMSACTACVTYPVYLKLKSRFKGLWPATIYTAGLAILTALPVVTITLLVMPQAVTGLHILDELVDPSWMQRPENQAMIASLDEWLKDIPGLEGGLRQLFSSIAGLAGSAARTVITSGVGLAGGALNALLVLLIFVMVAAMCTIQGRMIREFGLRLSRLPVDVYDRFTHTIRKAILGVMVGIVFVAMIQGFLCGVGFRMAGVPQPAFWGLLATFVAPIPFVGTSLVWLPIVIWLWFTSTKTAAIGTALWCVLVVTSVDNLLRPLFLKTGINATLIVLILSIFCGLAAFGPVGVFAGPVLVAVAVQAGIESSALDPRASNDKESD